MRHQSDILATDRCVVDIDPREFIIWQATVGTLRDNSAIIISKRRPAFIFNDGLILKINDDIRVCCQN